MTTASTTRILLCPLVAVCWATAAPWAAAQSSEQPRIAEVRLGFVGVYKLGCWTPVEVDLVGGASPLAGRVRTTVPDSDGVPTTVRSPAERPVSLQPGETTTARLFVRMGQSQGTLQASFYVADKVVCERTFYDGPQPGEGVITSGVAATNRLLLQYGPALGLGDLVRYGPTVNELTATRVVRIEEPAQLPTRWYGYEGVDTVLLTTSQVELYRPLEQSRSRVEALREWVERGGKLVLFCGRSAEELLRPGGVLADFVPGEFEAMVPLRQSLPIESYSGSDVPITRDRRLDLRAPKLTNVRGMVLAHGGKEATDLPLVVRSRLGIGEVVFLGLDFDQPPLRDWPGRTAFLQKALNWPAADAVEQQNQSLLGYESDDMVGKLRHALDSQFAGVSTVPFALVAALVTAYILMIGPGDYLLVTKLLRRMELTWITFPLIVAGVSAGAYGLAYWMKGDQLRVNQVEIVDVDVENNRACGTVWTHFFSPQVAEYDLTLQPRFVHDFQLADSTQVIAWLGVPGYASGGMQGAGEQPSLFDRGYVFSDALEAMRGVPVELWSTKTITARWSAEVSASIRSQLQRAGEELLQGQIVNDTGQALEDCIVLYGPWAYFLGHMTPAAVKQIDSDLQPRTVKTMLTSATAGDVTETRTAGDGTVPFRLAENDVARLVKAMMFFDATGGARYTGVLNRYQSWIDLSPLLRQNNCAILLARSSTGGSQWFAGDEPFQSDADRRWTYYRFLLPVIEKDSNR